jgi:hypothetical protein
MLIPNPTRYVASEYRQDGRKTLPELLATIGRGDLPVGDLPVALA